MALKPRFDYGDSVRVIRTIRNDGTYPGMATGQQLVRRGSIGYVRDIGVFLQDQIIYSVHFITSGDRTVGCRERELIPADAPWTPNRFEFRDKVIAVPHLTIAGKTVVAPGTHGEVLRVLADHSDTMYHVRFPGHTLQVPEDALAPHL